MTARLFRDGFPVGPVVGRAGDLPVVHPPVGSTTYEVVPRSCEASSGDLWVVEEVAYVLLGRCGHQHRAWHALVDHMRSLHGDDADEWLGRHEVWSARRADPSALRVDRP